MLADRRVRGRRGQLLTTDRLSPLLRTPETERRLSGRPGVQAVCDLRARPRVNSLQFTVSRTVWGHDTSDGAAA